MRKFRAIALALSFLTATHSWASGGTSKYQIDSIHNSTGGAALAVPSTGSNLVSDTATQTLQNKTLDGSSLITTAVSIEDTSDATKQLAFSLSGNTTGKTLTFSFSQSNSETLAFPNVGSGDSVATLNATQTFGSGSTWNGAVIGTTYGGAGTQFQESPSGTCNGSTTTFTLSHTPYAAASLEVFIDGLVQIQGSGKDYTISGTTITLSTACASGQTLYARYAY